MKAFLKGVWAFCSYLLWPQIHHKHLPNNEYQYGDSINK